MERIDHETADPDLHGVGKAGFVDGDPEAQVPGTVLTSRWLNGVQEAIARAIEKYEPIDPDDPEQFARLVGVDENRSYDFKAALAFRGMLGFFDQPVLGGTSNELLYANGLGSIAPRERTVVVPMGAGRALPGSDGVLTIGQDVGPYMMASAGTLLFPVQLPRGVVVTRLQAIVGNRTALQNGIAIALNRSTLNFGGDLPSSTALAVVTPALAGGGGVWYTEPLTVVNAPPVDNATSELHVTIYGEREYRVAGLRVTYLDPGPRNG